MKKILLLCVVLVLFISTVSAQMLQKEQAKADLKFCYDALKTAHPSLYRYTKENEFNNIYKFLDARIPDSLPKEEFGELVNILVSTARCSHTSASNSMKAKSALVFNFPVVIYKNKLYARSIKEYSTDTNLCRIISINNVPAIEIVDRMMMLKTGDGFNQNFTEAFFSHNFNTFFNVLYKTPDVCPIVIETDKGKKELQVERQKKYTAKYKDYEWDGASTIDTMSGAKFLKLKNIPDTRVLRVKTFKKTNTVFYKNMFDGLKRDSVKQLVIDLRGNTGGNINHAFYLLNNIIDKDIYMYTERRKAKIAPYLSLKGKAQWMLGKLLYDVFPNGQRWNDNNGLKYYRYSYKTKNLNAYKPHIIVLTDGLTVSSGSLVAAYLKYYENAEIIGTESGGTYTGNNGRSFPEVVLPNSKINIRLPLFYINYFPGVPNTGKGVAVDAMINPLLDRKSQEEVIQNQLLKYVEK